MKWFENDVKAEVEAFKRKLLEERLSKVSESQRAFFHKIYSKGVPEESLISAIALCDRTIAKNEEDPSRLLK